MKLTLIAAALALTPIRFSMAAGDAAASATLLDLNDVLNTSIDGVEDAPEFVTPPEGSYRLSIQSATPEKYKTTDKETKEEVERTRIRLTYRVEDTKELSNAEEIPVAVGSLFSEQFMTNQQGLSYFKRQAKNILGEDAIKGATIGEILNELPQGHSFDAEVKVKETQSKELDRNGRKKVFTNVQVRIKAGTGVDAELPASS